MAITTPPIRYEPTWESVQRHPLPDWYDDAKLGVFFHWGLYSVPGWAPRVPDIQTMLQTHPPSYILANNPYAEWYLNSMSIPGSATSVHHQQTYGANYPYDNFVAPFDAASGNADLGALAQFCADSGARYAVLTTKHHDGFCLWPSSTDHPTKGRYHAERDLVGAFTTEMRSRGIRPGLYYSGGFDWPVNGIVMDSIATTLVAAPQGDEYVSYVTSHLTELIDHYHPDLLWNDISFPHEADLAALFAQYYNTVPDGVVNDRWAQTPPKFGPRATSLVVKALGFGLEKMWRIIPNGRKVIGSPQCPHFDFSTPEYSSPDHPLPRKWEATRGVGHSFGANRSEPASDILDADELVRIFVDVVSKGGNLLIGVGPSPDGTIPDTQRTPLIGLGEWLRCNGEAIYGTHPAATHADRLDDGTEVRFTTKGRMLNAILMSKPRSSVIEIPLSVAGDVTRVSLGSGEVLPWQQTTTGVSATLPVPVPVNPSPGLVVMIELDSDATSG